MYRQIFRFVLISALVFFLGPLDPALGSFPQDEDLKSKFKSDLSKAQIQYERGDLETALNSMKRASINLTRMLVQENNQNPVSIRTMGFYKENWFEEGRFKSPPHFMPGEEFYVKINIDDLDWEEQRGRFRFNLMQSVKITDPDGLIVLEEMPVDTITDWNDYMTGLNISNRVPVESGWKPGIYRVEITVHDGLARNESHAIFKKERRFQILEKTEYASFTKSQEPVSRRIPKDFMIRYEWGRNPEAVGERGFTLDAHGNLLRWEKIGGDNYSYTLPEGYRLTGNEMEKILEVVKDTKLVEMPSTLEPDNDNQGETERLSLTMDGDSHTLLLIDSPREALDRLANLVDEFILNKTRSLDTDRFFKEFCRITKIFIEKVLYSESQGKAQFKESGVKRDGKYFFSVEVEYTESGEKKSQTFDYPFPSLGEIVEVINSQLRDLYGSIE